jgi:hypothetical protein
MKSVRYLKYFARLPNLSETDFRSHLVKQEKKKRQSQIDSTVCAFKKKGRDNFLKPV